MNTCPKCGAYIPDGGKMCIACGWKPEKEGGIFSDDNPYINYLQQVMDTVKNEFPKDEDRIQHDNTGWIAAAGYLGPAFLYTYFKNRDNELICYHANQSCLIFLCHMALNVVKKLPLMGGMLKKAGDLALTAVAFMGAKNAVAKKLEPAPLMKNIDITLLKK